MCWILNTRLSSTYVQHPCSVKHKPATALNPSAASYEIQEASFPNKVTKLTDSKSKVVLLYLGLDLFVYYHFKISFFLIICL